MGVVLLAMFLANSPWGDIYASFWNYEVHLQIGEFNFFSHNGHHMTLMTFINDALMAVFFFSVGLEIKREILVGELSSFRQALLPIVAACGGMLVPVLIYYFMTAGTPAQSGLAIPMATDIAFSLGVLSLFGKRVPLSLKVFLTAFAVVDDIGGKLGGSLFKRGLNGVNYLGYGVGHCLPYLLGGDINILRQAVHEVSALDIHRALAVIREGGADLYLDILSGSLTDKEVIFLLDVGDDGLIKIVARNTAGIRRDNAAKRYNSHLGGAAADIDDHAAGRFADGETRADSRRHGLLDKADVVGACALCGVVDSLALNLGDARGDADEHSDP